MKYKYLWILFPLLMLFQLNLWAQIGIHGRINDYSIQYLKDHPTQGSFSFAQITDTHVGGSNEWGLTPARNTIKESFDKILNATYTTSNPKPSFVIVTGDVVENGLSNLYQCVYDFYFNETDKYYTKMPLILVAGNHDIYYSYYDNNNVFQSGNNKDLFPQLFGDFNFFFDYGNSRFLCINNTIQFDANGNTGGCYTITNEIQNFADNALNTALPFKFAFTHSNIYLENYDGTTTCSNQFPSQGPAYDQMRSLFEKYDVIASFAGHASPFPKYDGLVAYTKNGVRYYKNYTSVFFDDWTYVKNSSVDGVFGTSMEGYSGPNDVNLSQFKLSGSSPCSQIMTNPSNYSSIKFTETRNSNLTGVQSITASNNINFTVGFKYDAKSANSTLNANVLNCNGTYTTLKSYSEEGNSYEGKIVFINDNENINTQINRGKAIEVSIVLSPNPVNDILTISSNSELLNIEIFDNSGKSIIRQILTGTLSTINIKNVFKGNYFAKVLTSDGYSLSKIIKN